MDAEQSGGWRFGEFHLDPAERRLSGGAGPVELNGRYLDALILLVRDPGKLVTKDRFMDDVWRGIPVTDEALTQCVKSLRRALGDDAARPRFIETVPKHGYRFIAAVANRAPAAHAPVVESPAPLSSQPLRRALLLGGAGTIGGGLAGLVGGLIYGFIGASQPIGGGPGAASVLFVLTCVAILVALTGGAGVSFGIALSGLARPACWYWPVLGGAAGGMITGALAKLLGLDAFALLLGRVPQGITGGVEGLIIGAAAGAACWLTARASLRRAITVGLGLGIAAGAAIALAGGRLLAGSLDLLAAQFPDSRLKLDRIGAMFGDTGFGPFTQGASAALECGLFLAFVTGAMWLARRDLDAAGRPSES